MLERILFNPDNRLIGSWTNDFGTYGGQGTTTATLRAPAPESGELAPSSSTASHAAPASHIQAAPLDLSAVDQFLPSPASDVGYGALTAPALGLAPFATAHSPVPAAAPTGDAVPAPSGSGSLAVLPALHTTALLDGSGAASSALAGNGLVPSSTHTLDGVAQVVPDLAHDAGAVLGSAIDTVGTVVTPVGDLAVATIDGVTDAAAATLAPVVGDVVSLAQPALANVADLATTTIDGVGDLANATLTPAVDAVANLAGSEVTSVTELATASVDGMADATTAVLAPVTDSLATLTAPMVEATTSGSDALVTTVAQSIADVLEPAAAAAPVVDAAADTLAEATSGPLADAGSAGLTASTDTLDDLAGTDPAGGVNTLLSLVSVGDVFDMHQVDGAGDAATGGDTGMLDALTADMPATDPLLGEHHDSDSGTLGNDHSLDHSHLAGL